MKGFFLVGMLSVVSVVAPARAIVLIDGDFNDWTFSTTGTAAVTREIAGGNPTARLNVTTISGPTVWGTAIKNDFTTQVPLAGENFTLQLDVLSGPGSYGQGQGILLLVEQNANIYASSLGITGFPRNFSVPMSFHGSFLPNSFGLLLGSGAQRPDFSGGTSTRFGFAASNTISGRLTQFYDNFRLNLPDVVEAPIAEPSSIPEPCAILSLITLGIVSSVTLLKNKGHTS